MPEFFVDGASVPFEPGQTVLQAALAAGRFIPYFCWHKDLSIAGNCRICVVEVEGKGGDNWIEIACNMPVTEGMRVLTDSEGVAARRKATMQFITLNHPVDCGICDKAGECTLQDYHYAYNGEPSPSRDAKVHATKFYPLSSRITLDNERCIFCSRCVRFAAEISKSHGLAIMDRGDHSLVRPVEDGSFERDPYSDNVVDLCPVGALLSKSFLYKSRVWYLKPTPSVCPRCSRGCNVDLWHRKPEWKLNALPAQKNVALERVTPRENPDVNGPWMCNVGRDLAQVFERPRAASAMLKGRPVGLAEAVAAAHALIRKAGQPVALVSSWGSNEELAAFDRALGRRMRAFVKPDWFAQEGERVEDDFLIRADKNPNTATAQSLFGADPVAFPPGTDLVLVWGEGFPFGKLPPGVPIVYLNAYLAPENGHADVFLPITIQTERNGHYTNFAGVTSEFSACFKAAPGVADAEALFAALAVGVEVPA